MEDFSKKNESEDINVNPWKEISLSDYEKHMSLENVHQLQALNQIMQKQFRDFNVLTEADKLGNTESVPKRKVMILGVAGGNGLEHIAPGQYEKVYGVDINADYLAKVRERYPELDGMLECIALDLITEYEKLPKADFVIANLLVEYIGYEAFQNVIRQVEPEVISCVIQINPPADEQQESDWVSSSPYIHAFDGLDKVHHQMEEEPLWRSLAEIGYEEAEAFSIPLPNGKSFARLDFHQKVVL